MEHVEASFLKDTHNAAKEQVEQDDVSLCLADQQDVWVGRVAIHSLDTSYFQAHISAYFAGDCPLGQ